MNRKELTKTVMVISNLKKTFGLQGFHKKFSALRVKAQCATTVVFNLFYYRVPSHPEKPENEFQIFQSGKSWGIWQNASNQGRVMEFYHGRLPKKVVVTSFCCLFHNQMTYLLNNNDWLWWLFALKITHQRKVREKSGNFVSMKCWGPCIRR